MDSPDLWKDGVLKSCSQRVHSPFSIHNDCDRYDDKIIHFGKSTLTKIFSKAIKTYFFAKSIPEHALFYCKNKLSKFPILNYLPWLSRVYDSLTTI